MTSSRLLNNSIIKLKRSATTITCNRSMSFDFTDEQKEVQKMVMKFTTDEIIPAARKHDKSGEYPTEILKKAFDLGIVNPVVPQKYGGQGMSILEGCVIFETMAFGCSGIALAIQGSFLPMMSLLRCANEEQKMKYLGILAKNPCVASLAVTEAHAGSDVSALQTKAVKKGDEYILNGTKCWITGGGPAKFFVVLARTDPDPKTSAGKAFTMFIVDGDSPGITRGKKEENMGQRASDTRTITFEDVRVPKENVIGAEGGGFAVCMKTFDGTRPLVAAGGVGISWRALDESVKYSLERKTFGTEIANHQAIQFILADMAVELEQFRLMTYKAATLLDNKHPSATYYASIAKLSGSDKTQTIVSNAAQVFGGAGFNCEYPTEKLMRDAKILQIYEGTSQIQRMIIARKILENYKRTNTVLIR